MARAADHPRYGWELNKGYAAPEHVAALREHGPCAQHRRSWSLPGVGADLPLPGQAALAGVPGEGEGTEVLVLDPEAVVELPG